MTDQVTVRNQNSTARSLLDLQNFAYDNISEAKNGKRFVDYFNYPKFPYHRWCVKAPETAGSHSTTAGYVNDTQVDHGTSMYPSNGSCTMYGVYADATVDFWFSTCQVQIKKVGSPTGTCFVRVYDIDGTTILGESGMKNVANISTSYTNYDFTFRSRYRMQHGMRVVLVYNYDGGTGASGSSSNYLKVAVGNVNTAGNAWESTEWTNNSGWVNPTTREPIMKFPITTVSVSGFSTEDPVVQMGDGGNQNPQGMQIRSGMSSGYGHVFLTWGLQYTGDNSGLMFEPTKHCGFNYVAEATTGGSSHGGNGYVIGLANKDYFDNDADSMAIEWKTAHTNDQIMSSNGTQNTTDMGVARDTKINNYKITTDGSRIIGYRNGDFCVVRTVNIPDAAMQPIIRVGNHSTNGYMKVAMHYYEAWNEV